MKQLFFLLTITLFFSCRHDDTVPVSEIYYPSVKNIIANNCLSCHGSAGSWAGRPTVFDTDDQITSQYELIKRVVADPVTPGPTGNRRMPQGGMLSASDIDIIVKWYEKGGKTTD
ncbi:MAG: hypothetical protein WCR52_02660 [Bacteroidota bacterium]